jgi:hypothetical protein
MTNLTPYQIKKYDVTQKLLNELADLESRQILFSIIKHAQNVTDISISNKIPLSTVYSKLKSLERLSLAYVEKIEVIEGSSRKIKYYRSRIKRADISISKQTPELTLLENNKNSK